MSDNVFIKDSHGTQIPLLDDFGNLSMQVIMLYTEDKLTANDRKAVDDFVATDEMSRDALEGFMMTTNASRTRHVVNEMNAEIQKRSGAKAISPLIPKEESNFDFRKMAAAIGLLVVLGGATFLVSKYWNQNELADNSLKEERSATQKPVKQVEPEPVYQLTDSVLDENLEQDKTKVDEVSEQAAVPTETETKRFEEPNQAVLKEKKADKEEDSKQTKPEKQKEEKAKDLLADESENAKNLAGATTSAAIEDVESSMTEEELAADVSAQEQSTALESAETTSGSQLMAESVDEVASLSRTQRAKKPAGTEDENQPARFPGGDIKMYKFIERKKNYPEALKQQGVSGAITVTFDVDENGRVTNSKVKKSVNGILDADALRVVRSMPKWEPATENGKPVKSSRSVVVKYGD